MGYPSGRQRGAGFFGWMLTIAIVLMLATLVIRILPHYIDHRTIVSVVQSLGDMELAGMSTRKVREALDKRLKINGIREFDHEEYVDIERRDGALVVDVAYEVREHIAFNVDVVLSFEERVETVID